MDIITNKGTTITLSTFQRYYINTRFMYWPNSRKNFKMIDCGVEFRRPGMRLHYKRNKETGEVSVGFEERGGGVATKYYTKEDFEV